MKNLGFGISRGVNRAVWNIGQTMPNFLKDNCPVVYFVCMVGTAKPQIPDTLVPNQFKDKRGRAWRPRLPKTGSLLWRGRSQQTYWPERWQWFQEHD